MAMPADAERRERMLWAGLSAIVGLAHDGTDKHLFERLQAACSTFGVRDEDFDALAKLFGHYYYRPWDCYLSRETFYEVGLREGYTGWMPPARGVH